MTLEPSFASRQSRYLGDLPFTDLYVRLDSSEVPARFRPDVTRLARDRRVIGNFPVPPEFSSHVENIRGMLLERHPAKTAAEGPTERESASAAPQGALTYEAMRLRYVVIETEDERWAAMRAMPLEVPDLETLRLNPDFVAAMKGLALKKGLILIGGRTGDGKTTTSFSYLNWLLTKYRGLLFTVEDPPEYSVHGAVADGAFCIQYEIKDDSEWKEAARIAMRSRPDYIFFGEIRTPEAAESLLKTLTSGHLVVATIHAGEVSDTIAALTQLAEHKLGRVARDSLAERLLCASHQTLTPDGPRVACLMPGAVGGDVRRQMVDQIKAGGWGNLANLVEEFPPTARRSDAQGRN